MIDSSPITCAVVGAGGYTGGELVRLLVGHPSAELVGLFGSAQRESAQPIGDVHPSLRSVCDLAVEPASIEAIVACGPRAVLLCTPHEVSHDLVPMLIDAGLVVLDLSGAFRLGRTELYERHYGFTHKHEALLRQAVYGLAELAREDIADADLIAVPGCYPTSAILPLAPLVRAGALDPGDRPIIDSVSGVSGAGRTPQPGTTFGEVSLRPYAVLSHRHQPEIDLHSGVETVFTPHIGPFHRGILSTIHARLAVGVTGADARGIVESAYMDEPFIRVLPQGQWPSVASVERSNFCDIALAADDAHRHLVLISTLDNLIKGAAGQAVQCLNIRFGLGETTGLLSVTSETAQT